MDGGQIESHEPRSEEVVPQSKITTTRITDRMLYRKTSIRFRGISNYGTDSEERGMTTRFVDIVK